MTAITYEALLAAKARRDAITTRVLAIDADLAERKRLYFVDGIQTPLTDRVVLEAERTKLVEERHKLQLLIHANKTDTQIHRSRTSYGYLVRALQEAGMHDMVREADRRATEQTSTTKENPNE